MTEFFACTPTQENNFFSDQNFFQLQLAANIGHPHALMRRNMSV